MMKFNSVVWRMSLRDWFLAIRRLGTAQVAVVVALASLALGCRAKSGSQQVTLFPESGEITGWAKSGQVRTFAASNLWEYIDGDAERFIQAGVNKTLTADYRYRDKVDGVADIYQMSAPAGAQKIFSTESATDSQPRIGASIGSHFARPPKRETIHSLR